MNNYAGRAFHGRRAGSVARRTWSPRTMSWWLSERRISVPAMTSDYLAHLRADSARFAAVLAGTDPAASVPSCPDWSAADLVAHLTEVQTFWGTVVAERSQM